MGTTSIALQDGDLIDSKYRIVRFLGRGAWASVYEGVNVRIGRRVAIKVLAHDTLQKPGVVERFEREAQAATRIESEHVVHVFDLGTLGDGRPYIVMELLEGEDFAQMLGKHGPLKEERVVFYGVQALRGLADAHAAGIMHRDIKPDNVFLLKNKHGDEIVKIVDFGISKLQSGAQVTSMTQTNAVLGSPVYMSPEQCRGAKHMDHRSDLYSVGVMLFEALTGHLPHRAETFNELMFKIALEDAPSPLAYRSDLDTELAGIISHALARDPVNRFQTALEFEAALIAWAEARGLDPDTWFQVGRNKRRSRIEESSRYALAGAGVSGEVRALTGSEDTRAGLRSSDSSAHHDSAAHRIGPADANHPAFATAQTMEVIAAARATRGKLIGVAAAVGLLLIVAVVYLGVSRKSAAPPDGPAPTASASTAPPPSATAVATAPTATPTSEPTASASSAVATADSTGKPDPTAKATTTPTAMPTSRHNAAGKPSASAVASGGAPAASSAAPAPSAKSLVDGRSIRTNF